MPLFRVRVLVGQLPIPISQPKDFFPIAYHPLRGIDAAQYILSTLNSKHDAITLHDLHLMLFITECEVRRMYGLRFLSDTFINNNSYPYASTICEVLGPNSNISRSQKFHRDTYIGGTVHAVTPPVQTILNHVTQYYLRKAKPQDIEELTVLSPFVCGTRDGEEINLPLPPSN